VIAAILEPELLHTLSRWALASKGFDQPKSAIGQAGTQLHHVELGGAAALFQVRVEACRLLREDGLLLLQAASEGMKQV
jgi:hypothetical protein